MKITFTVSYVSFLEADPKRRICVGSSLLEEFQGTTGRELGMWDQEGKVRQARREPKESLWRVACTVPPGSPGDSAGLISELS